MNRLWLRSKHGLNVDVVASALTGLRSLRAAFAAWRVTGYDAVVVVLPPRGFRTQRRAARALAAVLGRLLEHTAVTIAGDDGELSAAARRRAGGRTGGLALTAEGSTADAVAVHVDEQLRDLGTRTEGRATAPGPAAALASASVEPRIDLRLGSIVTLVREGFGVDTAAINIFDGDDLWTVAAAGADRGRRAREGTLCEETSGNSALTIVPDVWADPQLQLLEVAHGRVPIRFYAAYPIEAQRGLRLGTLCVYDRLPRDPDDYDFTLLRDFAQLAEIEIAEAGRLPWTGA